VLLDVRLVFTVQLFGRPRRVECLINELSVTEMATLEGLALSTKWHEIVASGHNLGPDASDSFKEVIMSGWQVLPRLVVPSLQHDSSSGVRALLAMNKWPATWCLYLEGRQWLMM
jgi:hypothetical protein